MRLAKIDAALAQRLVREQFPAISAVTVTYLNEGCDSVAFEVDERLVFRFPKRADVEAQMATERAVLEALASAGPPVAIPMIRFHGRPTTAFPFQFAGYSKIPGIPAIRSALSDTEVLRIAPVVGRFLHWLHAMPLQAIAPAVVDAQEMGAFLDARRQEALVEFPKVAITSPDAPLERWRSWIEMADLADDGQDLPMVLLHNDFAAEHVLIEPATQRVTGVIDWSDVAIGDRATDFAGISHWGGERLMAAVLDAYYGPIDVGLHQRARFMAACRGVLDVSFGVEHHRPEYIDAGLRALTLNAGA